MGSERLSTLSVTQDNMADLPGYCALTFTLMPVGSTSQRSVQELGFASIGLLTPLRRLYPLPVRQASVLPTASSRFRLTTDTLAWASGSGHHGPQRSFTPWLHDMPGIQKRRRHPLG